MNPTFFSLDETSRLLKEPLSALRRELHEHPELSGQERETAARLRRRFSEPPFEVLPFSAGEGFLVRIRGREPGKRIILRADMDALPVTEFEGNPIQSQNPGVMHACGHDMHMSFICGAGLLLAGARSHFSGEVLLLFQPSEENGEGAQKMLDAGLFEQYPADCILGGHVKPELDAGSVSVRSGTVMAALDGFRIRIIGKGGHGACPQMCSDPIVAAASVITALQTVVSRTNDPNDVCVLSVCSVHGGNTDNVIPDTVTLEGTLRTVGKEQRAACLAQFRNIVQATASAMGCRSEVTYRRGSMPPVVNDDAVAEICRNRLKALLGEQHVTALPIDPISEDFSIYCEQIPGCFIGIGTAVPGEAFHSLHNSRFFASDDLLPLGATVFAEMAMALLNGSENPRL